MPRQSVKPLWRAETSICVTVGDQVMGMRAVDSGALGLRIADMNSALLAQFHCHETHLSIRTVRTTDRWTCRCQRLNNSRRPINQPSSQFSPAHCKSSYNCCSAPGIVRFYIVSECPSVSIVPNKPGLYPQCVAGIARLSVWPEGS